jgi:hypothetical protein
MPLRARLYAQAAISFRMRRSPDGEKFDMTLPGGWEELQDIVMRFLEAVTESSTGISAEGWVEGQGWDNLVLHLLDFVEGRGLPSRVAKGSDKSNRTSPFVAFMRNLQATFPSGFARHMHSDKALAEAINLARRKSRQPAQQIASIQSDDNGSSSSGNSED